MESIYLQLPDALLPWYKENHRQLPWREDRDPYHIWLSEIMLQQTRVEAVRGYYARFLEALPTIQALAYADDALLHKLWEGLGYYSRVRNLKKAAQVIQRDYDGVFPRGYKEVLALPGIGPYTAGAICSIAFNQPTPAVDGNVLRVVARLTYSDTPVDTPQFRTQTEKRIAEDNTFVINASLSVAEYIVSDRSTDQLQELIKKISDYEFNDFLDIEGELKVGEKFMEFTPDKEAIKKMVIELFYDPEE